MRIAIITGASSGMGREYACLADKLASCDEIWVIARRAKRLEDLADRLSTHVRALSLDLTDAAAIQKLGALLEKAAADNVKFEIALLVNAAGFGKFGTYADMTISEVNAMIDLNCRALVDLTQISLPYMTRGSRIIEFASAASFQPLPGLNVYAASKAFVRSYTRALRFELRGTGIRTTAVCPLWVKTEFIKVARETRNGRTVRHPFPQLSAHHVARWSWRINSINYPIATCCITGFVMRVFCKLLPNPLIMWIWEGLRRI